MSVLTKQPSTATRKIAQTIDEECALFMPSAPAGRHFNRLADYKAQPKGGRLEKKAHRRKDFEQAVAEMQHDNPLLIVPHKYHTKTWLMPVAFALNYLIPTRHMRFWWARLWFMAHIWLPGYSAKPPVPYLPQPSYRRRLVRAAAVARNIVFNEGKVITAFHLGGGVGKTTHSARLSLQIKKLRRDVSVDAIDCEEGTLIQRFARNTLNSFVDFLNNLKQGMIRQPSDLARYRTVTPEGVGVISWRREDQTRGVRDVTRQEMFEGIGTFATLSGIIVCDLPAGNGPKNRGVLDRTHQVQLVTIPAEDRLDQAVAGFGWLIENGYEHLARTAVVVVNRCRSYADVAKVRERFARSYGAYMDEVRFQPFFHSKNLQKGGRIKLANFSMKEQAQYAEATAALLRELADARRTDIDSMMTHNEVHDLGMERVHPLRSPRIGAPTPSSGPARPVLATSVSDE